MSDDIFGGCEIVAAQMLKAGEVPSPTCSFMRGRCLTLLSFGGSRWRLVEIGSQLVTRHKGNTLNFRYFLGSDAFLRLIQPE